MESTLIRRTISHTWPGPLACAILVFARAAHNQPLTSSLADRKQDENGPCPSGYPVRIETLFYEVWWSTNAWKDRWNEAKNTSQPFVLSTGDPTGYSLHGVR